jgi:hypothetical protein
MAASGQHLRQLNIYSQAHVFASGAPIVVCECAMLCFACVRAGGAASLCVCVVSHDNVWVGGA